MDKATLSFVTMLCFVVSLVVAKENTQNVHFYDEDVENYDIETIDVYPVSQSKTLKRSKVSRSRSMVLSAPPVAVENDKPYEQKSTTKSAYNAMATKGTGPIISTNDISIKIPNSNNADSKADYIYLYFNPDKRLRLYGEPCEWGTVIINGFPEPVVTDWEFPKNKTIKWNLNSYATFLKSVQQDDWDDIVLRTVSSDGIKIERVIVNHSGEEILDYKPNDWLDKPNDTYLNFAYEIIKEKMGDLNNPKNQVVIVGLLELGKTDGYKYGTGGEWCSEFASWCLRKAGWDTPTGNIGSDDMIDFFDDKGRLYSRNDVRNKTYVPKAGDYVAMDWDGDGEGDHSLIFSHWKGGSVPSTITNNTEFRTIEGNVSGGAVRTRDRRVGDILNVGKAQ